MPLALNPDLAVTYFRITQAGKLRAYVGNSLAFLEPDGALRAGEAKATTETETPQYPIHRSVVLHTLPASPHLPPTAPERLAAVDAGASEASTSALQSITTKSASLATSTVPRLISAVEIIKREYMRLLDARRSPRMEGLHQYNEVGMLEDVGVVIQDQEINEGEGQGSGNSEEARRAMEILQAMGGRNHLRQKQTPFMRITLSTVERPDLVAKGAWYQPPDKRKLSKKAKVRAKKRAKKAESAANEGKISDANTNDDIGA